MNDEFAVVIVGGGPAGLVLAIELGQRGISCLLVDDKPGTTTHPQAHATQARIMEHYRRLGLSERIRALGLPPDYKTDIVYFTRFGTHELTRMKLPTAREAAVLARNSTGSWSTPELPHRCPLLFIEPELLRAAQACASVTTLHNWRMTDFECDGDGVSVTLESVDGGEQRTVRAAYLAACDGARSLARRKLGFRYEGASDFAERAWMGGKMYSMYFRAPGLYEIINGAPGWMYFTLNPDRRCIMMAVNGIDTFVLNVQLKPDEQDLPIDEQNTQRLFRDVFGTDHEIELLDGMYWHGGHCLVSDGYARGRVFLAGDAVHLFSPTGGLGYNTAVEDVTNLGWKLAGAVKGWGGPNLLRSYEGERRAVGLRNTAFSRAFADGIGLYMAPPGLEDDGPAADAIRAEAGDYLLAHLRREFNIPGITFGIRYDGSPIVLPDGTTPPEDTPNLYTPTACPGGRAPHAWLADGVSLYDRFGQDFTLLSLGDPKAAAPLVAAAAGIGVPLVVLQIDDAALRDLYGADLTLIRPDQHVSWRESRDPFDASDVLRRAAGH